MTDVPMDIAYPSGGDVCADCVDFARDWSQFIWVHRETSQAVTPELRTTVPRVGMGPCGAGEARVLASDTRPSASTTAPT